MDEGGPQLKLEAGLGFSHQTSPRAPVYSKAQVQVKIEPMALFRLAIGVKSPGRDPKLHDTSGVPCPLLKNDYCLS